MRRLAIVVLVVVVVTGGLVGLRAWLVAAEIRALENDIAFSTFEIQRRHQRLRRALELAAGDAASQARLVEAAIADLEPFVRGQEDALASLRRLGGSAEGLPQLDRFLLQLGKLRAHYLGAKPAGQKSLNPPQPRTPADHRLRQR